jgi:hypothetical protein
MYHADVLTFCMNSTWQKVWTPSTNEKLSLCSYDLDPGPVNTCLPVAFCGTKQERMVTTSSPRAISLNRVRAVWAAAAGWTPLVPFVSGSPQGRSVSVALSRGCKRSTGTTAAL